MNYEYTEKELSEYSDNVLKKIGIKYGLIDFSTIINNENERTELIYSILDHQDYLDSKKSTPPLNEFMPSDVIESIAINLGPKEIINLCTTNKKFNNILCKNNYFQKEYGLKYLTKDISRLPINKLGKYNVIQELSFLEKDIGLIGKGYEIYLNNNINTFNYQKSQSKIFLAAAENGHLDIMEYLMIRYQHLQSYNNKALELAAENGHLNIIKYLLTDNITISIKNYLLVEAAKNGHLDIVKYLISKGAQTHYLNDKAMYSALKNGHSDVVKYLISIDLDPDLLIYLALTRAALYGNLELIKYLVSISQYNIDFKLALIFAAQEGYLEVVKYLISEGADIKHLSGTHLPINILRYIKEISK